VGSSCASPQPRAATLGPQQRPTPPHGRVRGRHESREGDILQSINSESGPPRESAGPPDVQCGPPRMVPDPRIYSLDPKVGSGPPRVQAGPLEWDPYPSVWGLGRPQWGPKVQDRTYTGFGQDPSGGPVPTRVQAQSSTDLSAYAPRSPPRRRPDAAMWPTARDISQRVEPDIRPPGYVAPAFIADKARCLPTSLTGDVPPQHLMSPIHSAGGVPVHSTGRRCAASVFNETYPFHWQAATYQSHRRHACPFHWQTARPYCRVHYAHHYSCITKEAAAACQRCAGYEHLGAWRLLCVTCISCSRYSIHYVLGPTCRGSAPL
jgi:hypothetical protein